jgi:cytoskeletal protein RodZ
MRAPLPGGGPGETVCGVRRIALTFPLALMLVGATGWVPASAQTTTATPAATATATASATATPKPKPTATATAKPTATAQPTATPGAENGQVAVVPITAPPPSNVTIAVQPIAAATPAPPSEDEASGIWLVLILLLVAGGIAAGLHLARKRHEPPGAQAPPESPEELAAISATDPGGTSEH